MKYLAIILSSGAIAWALPFTLTAAEPIMCTMQYDPVCATKDGTERTYGNSCTAGADGATFVHRGECGTSAVDSSLQYNGSLIAEPGVLAGIAVDSSVSVDAQGHADGDATTQVDLDAEAGVTTEQDNGTPFPEPAHERNIFVRAWVGISAWFTNLF